MLPLLARRGRKNGLAGGVRSKSTWRPRLKPMASLQVHIDRAYDRPGAAADILGIMKKHNFNLVSLDTQLHSFSFDGATMTMDFLCPTTLSREERQAVAAAGADDSSRAQARLRTYDEASIESGQDHLADEAGLSPAHKILLSRAVGDIRQLGAGGTAAGSGGKVAQGRGRLQSLLSVDVLDPIEVPWFPISIRELHHCVTDVLSSGTAEEGGLLSPDHPGFNDEDYKRRRTEIAAEANTFTDAGKSGGALGPIPTVHYTEEENRVWGAVYERLRPLHAAYACDEYEAIFPSLEREAGFSAKQIPQLAHVSEFLQERTGFRLWPVCGLLSARDFLNALAFRVFCSTQYIRHGGNPFYTPEPDVVHELLGHAPLFADPNFAEFSQKVGLASLGASDEEILRLANIYWFTIEFGLLRAGDGSGVKVMGAGILSSFGEMEWAAGSHPSDECIRMGSLDPTQLRNPELIPFDPSRAAEQPYPITTYQPAYFVGESPEVVKQQITKFCDECMTREFHPVYDPNTLTVSPNRFIARRQRDNQGIVERQAEKQREYFSGAEEARRASSEQASEL